MILTHVPLSRLSIVVLLPPILNMLGSFSMRRVYSWKHVINFFYFVGYFFLAGIAGFAGVVIFQKLLEMAGLTLPA